jgi:UDP-N-acetylglucosamine 3-dehydrogenase
MQTKRVALIGLGIMGYNHARVLSNLEGAELICIVDPIGDTRNQFSSTLVTKDIESALNLKPDYCVIAAPTAFHEEIALKVIAQGINFLIEKPISVKLESAKRICEAAKAKGVIGAVGHIERFNAALRQARERIHLGDLGEIYQITTRRIGPYPSRISDVGVVMDLATHDIDLTSWLTGERYESIAAQKVSRSGRSHEDLITVAGRLSSGIVVNHSVNWLSPLKERKTIITGEKGTFVVDTLTTDLTFYANGTFDVAQDTLAHFKGVTQGDIQIYAFPKPEPLLIEHQNFLAIVNGLDSEIVTLSEGAETVRVAQAIIESSNSQETVKL